MIIQNQEAKQKLIQRLRRIEGQVRGVQGMLDEERDYVEDGVRCLPANSFLAALV